VSILDRRLYTPRKTDAKKWLALYWMRRGPKRSQRGLVNRLRKVTYPNARKAGPTYPSIRPSRPDFPKFCI
jgi:hypothetical protein